MKSGQILILILLVVVVALAVGLSVASRNITNLRTSTQTEQSQRAFSAAEGGVEDVLSRLKNIAENNPVGDPGGANITVPVGDISANVNVKSNNTYEFTLKPGEVGQVNLLNADGTYYSGQVQIEWIKSADLVENASPKATIEVAIVCEPNSTAHCGSFSTPGDVYGAASSGYSQNRAAFQAETINGQTLLTGCATDVAPYVCKNPGTITLTAADKSRIIRIKPFWKQATIKVSGTGANFPVQTYDVESTAKTDIGVTRRVKVTRTALEQLPAAFDYVLFSEGNITK